MNLMKCLNTKSKLCFLLLIFLPVLFISHSSPKINTVLGYTSHSHIDIFTNSDFTAPFITDVNHTPFVPTEIDVITVGVNVTDASGIFNVTLHFSINRGPWLAIEMTVSFAYPEIFLESIGAFAAGDLIQYYITAFDASGNWNEGINNNGGSLYSFTIIPAVPEFNSNPTLMIVITLGLVAIFYLVIKRKK